jgi:hypothetical protein
MQTQNFVRNLKDKQIKTVYEISAVIISYRVIFFFIFFPNIPNENQITNVEKQLPIIKKDSILIE